MDDYEQAYALHCALTGAAGGPLDRHPRVGGIEAALRQGAESNQQIAARFGVRGIDGSDEHIAIPPEQVVRLHRLQVAERDRVEEPTDQRLARMEEPPLVPLPAGDPVPVDIGETGEEWAAVHAGPAGRVGPSGRWVGPGDLLTAEEAGDGHYHGTAYRLPARRGVIALLIASMHRAAALEQLIVDGDEDELQDERDRIRELRSS